MMFQQDWVLRQIDILVRMVAKMVFHKDTIRYDIADESNLTNTDTLYIKLRKLIAKRRICEAEDLLYDNLEENNPEYLKLALDFYQTINHLTDEELEANNFSRQEVSDGLNGILRRLNQLPILQQNNLL